MTSGVNGSKVSKSIRGEAHLFIKDLYKNKQMSSNDSILSWKDSPVRPNLNKRSDGSTRGRIWGTKFQEIYKGCRNKYITLNDNRCKHIPEEPKVKVRYSRTQKTGREFFKEMQMEVSGKKNKKRKEIVLVYICTNIAWSPKST